MFTAARNPPAKPSAVLENAGGFGRCRPAQIRRIGLSHGVWIVLKPAAVHQLFNPLDIQPPIVIRLTGTNEERGVKILEEAGFSAYTSMDAVVEKAVELAKACPIMGDGSIEVAEIHEVAV